MSKDKRMAKSMLVFISLIVVVLAFVVYGAMTSPVPQSRTLTPNTDVQQTQTVTQETQEAILQFVSGTEYIPGQTGQVIVEARFRNGSSALVTQGTQFIIDVTQQTLYDDLSVDSTGSSIDVDTVSDWFFAGPNETENRGPISVSGQFNLMTFTITESGMPGLGSSQYYYDFRNNATDVSGNNNDALLQNGANIVNETVDLSGGGDYVDSQIGLFDNGPTDFTLSFDFTYDGTNQALYVCSNESTGFSQASENECGMSIDTNEDTTIRLPTNSSSSSSWYLEFSTNYTIGQEYKALITFDYSTEDLTFELDGVEQPVQDDRRDDTLVQRLGTLKYGLMWDPVSGNPSIGDFDGRMDDIFFAKYLADEQQKEYIRNEAFTIDRNPPLNYTLYASCDGGSTWTGDIYNQTDVVCPVTGSSLEYNLTLQSNETPYNMSVDADLDADTTDKWEGKLTYMDGRTQNVCQYKGGQYGGSAACPWVDNSGDSYYKCGQSESAMQRIINETDGNITTGVSATLAIEPVNDPESYAAIYITDNNASEWRMVQGGEINCNYPPTYEDTYYGPVGADGVVLDTTDFTLYQVVDGQFSQLAHSNTYENAFCTPSGVYGACDGSGKQEFDFEVKNGRAVVKYNNNLVFNVSTEYYPNNKTTYGFLGNDYFRNTILRVYEVDTVYATQEQYSLENVTNCVADVQYPNKTYYMSEKQMILNQNGNAYTSFAVPNTEGVYEYQTSCTILGNDQRASKSFHVTDPGIGAMVVK